MVHKSIEAWAASLERPEENVLVACGAYILNHYFSQLSYTWKKVNCEHCLKHKKKVIGLTDFAGMEEIEELVKDSLKTALKLKGN